MMKVMISEATRVPAKIAPIKPAVSTSTLVNGPISAVVARSLVVTSERAAG